MLPYFSENCSVLARQRCSMAGNNVAFLLQLCWCQGGVSLSAAVYVSSVFYNGLAKCRTPINSAACTAVTAWAAVLLLVNRGLGGFCCFVLILLFMGLEAGLQGTFAKGKQTSLVHGWVLPSVVVRLPAPALVAAVMGTDVQRKVSFFQGRSVTTVVVRLWTAFVKSGFLLLPSTHCWNSISCRATPNSSCVSL